MMIEKLEAMTRDQLVELAMQQGLPKPHHKTKPESIIKVIMDSVTHPATPKQAEAVVKKEAVFMTKQEIETMIAPIKARVPNFQTIYDNENRCVTFRFNGAEDCMSMSVAPRWMYEKARMVSRGRLALKGHSSEHFERGTSTGISAYTNVVLA